ncbi:MAG: hypothetical protein AAF850_10140, partial [Pseudomonadota bacterium]
KRIADAAVNATQREADRLSSAARLALASAHKSADEAPDNGSLKAARKVLAKENARLETLISEQRQRANRLASTIAAQTERLSRINERPAPETEEAPPVPNGADGGHHNAETQAAPLENGDASREKGDLSWREILNATDGAAPLDLPKPTNDTGPPNTKDAVNNAAETIKGMQAFTMEIETRLFGEPAPAMLERFDAGDRNIFANRLLRLNEADLKKRIRTESAKDKGFEKSVHAFLHGFEALLEDATASEMADEELEDYLMSPLGKVYLLVGSTVGYFA